MERDSFSPQINTGFRGKTLARKKRAAKLKKWEGKSDKPDMRSDFLKLAQFARFSLLFFAAFSACFISRMDMAQAFSWEEPDSPQTSESLDLFSVFDNSLDLLGGFNHKSEASKSITEADFCLYCGRGERSKNWLEESLSAFPEHRLTLSFSLQNPCGGRSKINSASWNSHSVYSIENKGFSGLSFQNPMQPSLDLKDYELFLHLCLKF